MGGYSIAGEAPIMTVVLCNRENCQYQNGDQTCGAGQIGIVDLMCITRRRRPRQDNYRELMRTFESNCDKNSAGGGYKSSRVKGVLK